MTMQERPNPGAVSEGSGCRLSSAFNSCLPDKVVFTRGGPHHRIADGKKECNFVRDAADWL
jgi:hypothetical protein